MQEAFLHYLFEYQLLTNEEFEIISPGLKNLDAGPDFFNSKIKIGKTIWAGNVEIHILSSDWYKHKHNKDKAYDNIILHLVLQKDKEVYSTNGQLIPSYEVKFDPKLLETYNELIKHKAWIHCENKIQDIDSLTKNSYIDALAIERLQRKSQFFEDLLQFNNNDWEESFFQAISKSFGGKVNGIPFELLAKSVPLKTLLKQQNNLFQIEAILFGQAGFLNKEIFEDEYFNSLKKEYEYLQKKYQLTGVREELFKFSRIRPYNFPTIKIALLSKLISSTQSLFSTVLECKSISDLYTLFTLEASEYWETHYTFGKPSKILKKSLGTASVQHLIINTIIPFLYVYSEKTNQIGVKEKCIEWFSELEPEENSITRKWEELRFENLNALTSQGLIELKNEKCNKHMCLDCRIGHKILTLAWNE